MAINPGPLINPPEATEAHWQPYRLNVRQFLTMIETGIFPRDARVELLGGVLIQVMTKGDPHDYTLNNVADQLRGLTPSDWILREDKSLQLGPRSRPEPDVAIVRGPRHQYSRRTPHARETALVVEVADSTYEFDRGEKWRAYAAARIPVYWIVNINQVQIEVYREPTGRGKTAGYREAEVYRADASVPVEIDGQAVGRIAVNEVIP